MYHLLQLHKYDHLEPHNLLHQFDLDLHMDDDEMY